MDAVTAYGRRHRRGWIFVRVHDSYHAYGPTMSVGCFVRRLKHSQRSDRKLFEVYRQLTWWKSWSPRKNTLSRIGLSIIFIFWQFAGLLEKCPLSKETSVNEVFEAYIFRVKRKKSDTYSSIYCRPSTSHEADMCPFYQSLYDPRFGNPIEFRWVELRSYVKAPQSFECGK